MKASKNEIKLLFTFWQISVNFVNFHPISFFTGKQKKKIFLNSAKLTLKFC